MGRLCSEEGCPLKIQARQQDEMTALLFKVLLFVGIPASALYLLFLVLVGDLPLTKPAAASSFEPTEELVPAIEPEEYVAAEDIPTELMAEFEPAQADDSSSAASEPPAAEGSQAKVERVVSSDHLGAEVLKALESGESVPFENGTVTVSSPVQLSDGVCRSIAVAEQRSTWCRQGSGTWSLKD